MTFDFFLDNSNSTINVECTEFVYNLTENENSALTEVTRFWSYSKIISYLLDLDLKDNMKISVWFF